MSTIIENLFNQWGELENELDFVYYELQSYDTDSRSKRCESTIGSRGPRRTPSAERQTELRKVAESLHQKIAAIKKQLINHGIDISRYE